VDTAPVITVFAGADFECGDFLRRRDREGRLGRKLQRLLRRACHLTNVAREQGVALKPGRMLFAVVPSILSTARKQGWGILHTLTSDPVRLITQLRMR
jgi:hypothetical protein